MTAAAMTAAAMPAAALATPAARREARRAAAESAPPAAAVPVQPPIVIRRGLLGRPRVIVAPGLVPVPGGIAAAPATPAPRSAGGGRPQLRGVLPQLGGVLPQLGAVLPQLSNGLPQAGAKPPQAGVAGNAKPPIGATAGTPPAPAPTAAPTAAATAAATPPTAAVPTEAVAEAIPAPRPLPMKESPAAAGSTNGADTAAFSPAWFAAHPDAWRPAPVATEWWRPADVAAITDWLGGGVTRAGGAQTAPGRVATAGAAADAAVVAADGLRSVLVLPTGRDEPAKATATAADPAAAEWLPLGVFAVVPPGGDSAANEQQLLVDRTGAIRGNFHDPLSGTVQPVTGVVDLSTRTASWTVGSGGGRFECGLDAFAAAPARIVVTAGGTSRTLDLVPIPVPTPGR